MAEHLSVPSDGVWQRMHIISGLSSQTEEDRQVSPWLPINKHYSEWVITKQPKKIIPGVSFSQQQGKVKMKRKHLNTWLKGLGDTFLPFVELHLATMLYQVLPMVYNIRHQKMLMLMLPWQWVYQETLLWVRIQGAERLRTGVLKHFQVQGLTVISSKGGL